MLFTTNETLDDKIVQKLIQGEKTASSLLEEFSRSSKNYTIQAVYSALRGLLLTETVVKRGKVYYLNEEWRLKAVSQLQKSNPLELSEGEDIVYNLQSLANNDMQWKNIILPLHEQYPSDPIFFYNFHYIWILLGESRKKSEIEYYQTLEKKKTHAFCVIAKDTPFDRQIKKVIQNSFVQVSVGKTLFPATEYKTIIHDYIITNILSQKLASEIESFYNTSTNLSVLQTKLRQLDAEKQRVKIKVERNSQKAKQIRKRFAPEFFLKKDLVQKFNLF